MTDVPFVSKGTSAITIKEELYFTHFDVMFECNTEIPD